MLSPEVQSKLHELLIIVGLGDLRELIEEFKNLDELSDECLIDLINEWRK